MNGLMNRMYLSCRACTANGAGLFADRRNRKIYKVSDHGRVRSVDRVIEMRDGRHQPVRGRILARQGGPLRDVVALWRDGQRKHFSVRRLMNAAFKERAA
jgi:hypothetical protein